VLRPDSLGGQRPGLKIKPCGRSASGLDPLGLAVAKVPLIYFSRMADDLSERYRHLLTGIYNCVDRIVLNAHFSTGQAGGGFRIWWRQLHKGSEDELDTAHLMRMAAASPAGCEVGQGQWDPGD